MLQPQKLTLSHEDLFIERYERLMFWALQLTERSRDRAEDLVHDAFVQFTFTRPDLATINNLDGYLYGILRNLRLLQMRRANRSPLRPLSIVEYDSAEIGIRAMGLQAQLRVQDELRMVCEYVCARKDTSKVGSALILRFFHGYFTGEISQVMQVSRRAVNERLRVARAEAKLFLASPNTLSFLKEATPATVEQPGVVRTMDELLHELRRAIFQTRRGECLAPSRLKELYSEQTRETIDNDSLGHLVSCRSCLDELNKLLGLPLLNERYPTDMLGPDKPSGGSGGGPFGKAPSKEAIVKCRRRASEVFDHRPQELCISVNGDIYIWHKINSALSEQSISLNDTETVDLVEVTSEQGMSLMFLAPEAQPAGPVKHSARIELSDDRALELMLDHSGLCPILHVAYHDPTFDIAESRVEIDQSQTSSLESQGSSPTVSEGSASKIEAQMAEVHGPPAKAEGLLTRIRPRWSDFGLWNLDFGFLLRPATVTSLLALILIGVVFFIGHQRTPAPFTSAAEVLAQSVAAEQAIAARTDQVLHRTVNLEEMSAAGALIARSKIEVWQSAERAVTARRIYDEQSRLVAGDWRRVDGVETLYAHGRQPQIQSSPDRRGSIALTFGNVWQQDLTAQDFRALVKGAENLKLDESASTYVLTYQSSKEGLKQATLVLSRSDLHATEQTLVVRQGNEERTYHYLETSFERRPQSAVAPAVFEPEPQLLSSLESATRSAKLENTTPGVDPRSLAPVAASAELEVEVLRLLNQAGADLGEQVNVTRTPEGRLRVEGIVDTEKRKGELLQALGPVRTNAAVRIDVKTVAEAVRQSAKNLQTADQIVIEQSQPAANQIPVDADVRRYFSNRGVAGTQLDTEISRFANRVLVQSRSALFRASALKRLADRFSQEELRTLDPDAHAKWRAMIREHAHAYQNELAILRRELAPVFNNGASDGDAGEEITDDASLVRAAWRLVALARANDEAIQAGFTLSSASVSSVVIRMPGFWRSFRNAEALAGRISRQ